MLPVAATSAPWHTQEYLLPQPRSTPQPQEGNAVLPGTDLATGLTSAEARLRLQQYGLNEVAERRRSPVLAFLRKFWGPTAWMIEMIIILSWVLQRYTDLVIVAALLIVNAVLSYLQEQRASAVVDALRDKLQVDARVLRDGQWGALHARLLVPGDVVRLRAGDYAPADVHINQGTLSVDQSALTGESELLDRGPQGTVYAGSVVKSGEATGVVMLTGAATYFGRTTELVQVARPRMHIEDVVARLVRALLVIVGVLLALAIVVAVARGERLVALLPLLLVLLMGAVPVALPVMFTVSMALGSKDLASKNVLVTRLTASEDAATMDVLCVDKTGTITTN
ncbi:MAG: HAD-IC family P-type ATPase, partial [Chloroflexi bacterium]|nr:HAD-IC family P-type ATPase [Chloroflexota bacterium]